MNRLEKLAGILNEEVKPKSGLTATNLFSIIRDLANAYNENTADDQITPDFKNYTIGQIINDYVNLRKLKEDATSAPPPVNTPSDVKNLSKAQTTATTVTNKAKAINNINEFPGAFENWFKTLGFQPGKVSKTAVRSAVEKVLTNLGYK
jgi:hypothetical protein